MFTLLLLCITAGIIAAIICIIRKNPLWKKWLIAVAVWSALLLVFPSTDNTSEVKNAVPQQANSAIAEEQVSSKMNNDQLEPKEQLEKIIQQATQEKLKRLDIIVRADGKLAPDIYFSGSENLSTSLTKKSVYKDGADLFEKIYTSGLPIYEVREFIYLPLTDKYGNTSDNVVVRMSLKNETALKINWKNVNKLEFDKVADSSWTHPALNKD